MSIPATYQKGDKYKCFILGEDTPTFGVGQPMTIPDWGSLHHDLLDELWLDPEDFIKHFQKLCKYDATDNKNSFQGNPCVYSLDICQLLETRYKGGPTMKEIYQKNPKKYWERVCKMDRRKGRAPTARDAYELNKAITFFKPTTAKHLIQRYAGVGGKMVFDPCAGWAGRLLGCISLGNMYIGCDTNPFVCERVPGCLDMLNGHLPGPEIPAGHPIFGDYCHDKWASRSKVYQVSCLDFDWKPGRSFDFALTSPPYSNLEVYSGMKVFVDDDDYYKNFLIPMINKCRSLVKIGGKVAINVSEKIYQTLTEKYEYEQCDEFVDFLQQMGQQSGKKKDYVYLWDAV